VISPMKRGLKFNVLDIPVKISPRLK